MSRLLVELVISIYLIAIIVKQTNAVEGQPHDPPSVDIDGDAGRSAVEGSSHATWTGDTYYAFRGIPYVQAPLGALRFKDPQPLAQLPPLMDARYDGHDCPSVHATNASENCLTLNVYTRNLTANASLPVLVFIHPGGLYVGSGLSSYLGPAYLLSKQLVLVTFNYRLGTLGFLQLNTRAVPGNAGLKDQVHALRWVQRHIHSFGGNASDVTIMGYSAGALSVQMHLVSPMSRGLYHKAIAMSGALPAQADLSHAVQAQLVQKQLKALNCTESPDEAAVLSCLNQHSGSEIASTLRRLFVFGHDNPIYLWLPIVEADFGQERFLAEDPYDSLRSGNFAKVPTLVGFTDGELCTSAASIAHNAELEQAFYTHFDALAPHIFMYASAVNKTQQSSAALRQHYLANSGPGHTELAQLCDLFSDAIIRYGAQRFAELAAEHVKVFTYQFNYRGRYSNFNYDTAKPHAEHMDDLMYLFRMQPHHFERQEADAKIVDLYTEFMFDFMKNGELQTPSGTPSHFPAAYALLSTNVSYQLGTFFDAATYSVWKRLFA